MKKFLVRYSAATFAALVVALSGCGGGGGGDTAVVTPPPDTTVTPPPPTINVAQAVSTAAAQAANDTSVNSTASFKVLQDAGVAAVTIASPPKVNFAVFSDGKPVPNLTVDSVSFAIAKLVPGTNGEPDQWVNYIYRTESTASGANKTGPGGVPALASAQQATTDAKQTDAALKAAQLVYNADGYYTYTFKTDIKDPTQTNGVAFEPARVHRVAIQLSYKNAAGATVLVNPYFDFTVDASGKSVAATARKMVDIGSCNNCHDKLGMHGGGRVDTQFCVMCHNPGTTDANSGNVLTLATMVHKVHAGAILAEKGEHYTIWGYGSSKNDYSEVGFPQPVRNCAVCHDGSNPKTPQGDNWKSVPSKSACLTCHQSASGTPWYTVHVTTLKLGASADAIANTTCASCHGASTPLSADKVHWVQELANTVNYQTNIESVTIKKAATATAAGTVTVKYAVVNPKTGAAYDLREGCSATNTTDSAGTSIVGCNANYRWDAVIPPALPGKPTDKFGMFTVVLAAENLVGVKLDDTTGGGSGSASWTAYRGVDDGSHHYTADLAIPAGAHDNARVMIIGAVSERRLDPVTRAAVGAVPPTTNDDLAYVPVKAPIKEFNVATGGASARRQIVSNDNCNTCHAYLGLPMGADTVGFHKGHRNNSEGCAVCHNANQAAGYTLMADGSTAAVAGDSLLPANTGNFLHESYQAKRFIHGIHYGEKRNYPFTHCMTVGGVYNKDGTSATGGASFGPATCVGQTSTTTTNFTAEVAYPGNPKQCANCHVNDSWKQDRSVLGAVVFKQTGKTNMLDWQVISPKAATCTACHDSKAVQTHVTTVGASFGTATQNDLLYAGKVFEPCEGCHAAGSAIGVDVVHGVK
jgi:OmcA/MtrC family decaheme c-type cytochrome